MIQTSEKQLVKSLPLTSEDIQALLHQEQAHNEQMSRVARGGTATDTVIGGVAGAGVGLLGSVAISAGVLPGLEGMATLGAALPVALGATLAGLGSLVGSFVDLHAVANIWRR